MKDDKCNCRWRECYCGHVAKSHKSDVTGKRTCIYCPCDKYRPNPHDLQDDEPQTLGDA